MAHYMWLGENHCFCYYSAELKDPDLANLRNPAESKEQIVSSVMPITAGDNALDQESLAQMHTEANQVIEMGDLGK